MNRDSKAFLDMSVIFSHASNRFSFSILEGVGKRTGAMPHY